MKYIKPDSLDSLEWVKSSFSGNNGNCVEVAKLPDAARAIRDSKNPQGPILAFSADDWSSFVEAVKGDEFPAM
ncbi:DUF397 domain-containing protein [Streptomyces sp. NPDC000941]